MKTSEISKNSRRRSETVSGHLCSLGCLRATGASRALFDFSHANGWILQISSYVVQEVEGNLSRLRATASAEWALLRGGLDVVPDVMSFQWPTVLVPAKDRPILFTAAAWSEVLLTLDRTDFEELLGNDFYGLPILRPGQFLMRERAAGRLV